MNLFALPILSLQFVLSSFFSSILTPLIISRIPLPTEPAYALLIDGHFAPEKDVLFYICFIILVALFILVSQLLLYLFTTSENRVLLEKISMYILPSTFIGLLVVGDYPFPLQLATDMRFYLLFMIVLVFQLFILQKPFSAQTTQLLFIASVAKYFIPGFLELDAGVYLFSPPTIDSSAIILPDKIIMQYSYLFIVLPLLLGIKPAIKQVFEYIRSIKFINPLITFATIIILVLVLLPFLTLDRYYGDLFFTTLPAYHIITGATPFVDVISQYGIIYLLPWLIWIKAFPFLPLSREFTSMVTLLFLFLYYVFFYAALKKITKNNILSALGTFTAVYYTLINRSFYFEDQWSLIGAPAFTPLRLGPMIFPFYFLASYIHNSKKLPLILFIIASVLMFFFSFEIGIGIAVSGLASICIYAIFFSSKKTALFRLVSVVTLTSLVGSIFSIVLLTLITKQTFPDFSLYYEFIKIFSSGFYLVPVDKQGIMLIPFIVSVISIVLGLHLMSKQHKIGIGLLYVSFTQLSLLPYYLGRSLPPLLYSILIPTILLMTMVVHIIENQYKDKHILPRVVTYIFGFILLLATFRNGLLIVEYWKNPIHTTSEIFAIMHTRLKQWDVKQSEQYVFLSSIPKNSKIVLFDNSIDLIAALHLKPALPYTFIRSLIVSEEQIEDALQIARGSTFYVFINEKEFYSPYWETKHAYPGLWSKLQPYSKLVKSDYDFSLYETTIP